MRLEIGKGAEHKDHRPGEKDGDSFYAYCPGLKGLHVDGATEEDAINHALEAASLYLTSMMRHNDSIFVVQ